MSIATTQPTVTDYALRIAQSNPQEALQIAVAEAERTKALAAKAQEEYRAMSEVRFDESGRIASANMAGLWRLAQIYAGTGMVPDHYKNRPHDCFIACQMAFRLRVDPFAYMQASYIVHGRPGLEAKLAIAMLNTSGKIKGRVKYRDEGSIGDKTRKCTAYATDAETGETVESTVDWKMVESEGWASKAGSKWKSIPDIMFRYRSATFLIRSYYPEVLMGMQLADELEDIAPEPAAPRVASLDDLTARLTGPGVQEPAQANGESTESQKTVEAAAEDAAADANQGPHAEDASQVNPLDGFAERLADCQDLAAVTVCENEFIAACETDEQRGEVAGRCQERRDAIKAARAKGKQGQLAGT